ncbi:MAG: molybdenum cofactor biosynthesis protein MoaE [Akkermansiaceae bacterium]|jgi:molybdopterin synthase catalytic subunit|nr:molybdenum cofactor biosynthesis protein MoaE [Akkermansiaceae bacterium]MDP4647232.1 molybdenum cofactor biosynthesis protein MoaE [Akkermansiaceae bacterium]MDP4719599.1 molybdenum cofactor biosynthesis protein MoaE [Akkermansiaceae bacterium]MDP4780890.1 molybdenum cofactor biosynthesis protein MoaE [Akkermansiaceae bacterium]MDP4846536.1 molybdenum cofactor biosynthesis protein MoaE [Akkermansiaceae bacterium]
MKITIVFTEEGIVVPEMVIGSREIGAVVEFQGLVREMEGEEALDGLFYEAYPEMAEKVLRRHLEELGEIHGCESVEFIHRSGWVPVGEASLYIRVLSAHRGEGLRFLADSIDRLKQDVPIWKRVS